MSDTMTAATFSPLAEDTDPALPGDPFSRPRYAYGQLLGAEDFTAEQRYHLLRARMRNALLHGSGVACGLELTHTVGGEPLAAEIRCGPGLAIDQLGREIFVPETICLDVTGLAANDKFWTSLSPPPGTHEGDKTKRCYAMLTYRACLSAQVPAIAPPCSDADNSLAWSRVLDSYRLCLEAKAPADPNDLSRDWINTTKPGPQRDRLQALLTSKPASIAELWSAPVDAKVLLAVVDLQPSGTPALIDKIDVDATVRALLPDVQTVAQIATGVRLVGPATAGEPFNVVSIAAKDGGAGTTIVTITLSAPPEVGTVTKVSVTVFRFDGAVWNEPPLSHSPTVGPGNTIVVTLNEAWPAHTTYQVVLSGGGPQPILDKARPPRPLAGFAGDPAPLPGRGRDACLTATFGP